MFEITSLLLTLWLPVLHLYMIFLACYLSGISERSGDQKMQNFHSRIMDDFPLRLECISSSKFPNNTYMPSCRSSGTSNSSSVYHSTPSSRFQLERGVNPPFYLQHRSTSYPKRNFISREDLDTLHSHFGLRTRTPDIIG